MDISRREKWERLIFRVSFVVTLAALFIVFALVIAQAYVRWSLNQNFTFLGGNVLEAFIISVFALLIALSYIHRARN